MMKFAPELQLPWALVSLSMPRSDRATIRLQSSVEIERPGPLGRHGRDVLSYPTIVCDRCEALFEFAECLVVRICEEHSHPGDDQGEGDGETFRRRFDSALLRAQRECRPELSPFFHYQIVCPNEVIDIICQQPPAISLRRFANGPVA